MIVWGGENPGKLNTGSFYDPASDTWSGSISTVGCPVARSHMPGVWTGREMIVWGGASGAPANLDTGARYNPTTDSWTDLPLAGVPEARSAHTLVWTGSEMIAWGGVNATTNLNTGGIYRPPALIPGTYLAEILITATTLGQATIGRVTVSLTVTP
jgi:hypothetical protein